MVHHDGHVPLALAVADLVDPDPSEPVEQIDLAHPLRRRPVRSLRQPFATRCASVRRPPVFDVFTANHAT